MRVAHRCRAYPTDEQAANLARTFGCVRKVWNEVLDWRTKRYRVEGLRTSYAETDRFWTELKKRPDLGFPNEVSSVPLQQTLRHHYPALNNFFARRARYPRLKSRRGHRTATYTRSAFRYRDGQFFAKQSRPLRFVWTWPDIDPAAIEPSSMVTVIDVLPALKSAGIPRANWLSRSAHVGIAVGRLVWEVRAERLCRLAALRALMRATDLREGGCLRPRRLQGLRLVLGDPSTS